MALGSAQLNALAKKLGEKFPEMFKYLIIGRTGLTSMFKRSVDGEQTRTFTSQLAPNENTINLAANVTQRSSFHRVGNYMVITGNNQPYIEVKKWNGSSWVNITTPTSPSHNITQVVTARINAQGTHIAITSLNSPFVRIWKINQANDTVSVITPFTFTTGAVNDLAWSGDGNSLALAHNNTPFISVYDRSGDTFTRLNNPATLPTSNLSRIDFNPAGTQIVCATAVSNSNLIIYSKSGTTLTKEADPATNPTGGAAGTINSLKYNHNGTRLAVGISISPRFSIYDISGTTYTRQTLTVNPIPSVSAERLDWSSDSSMLAVSFSTLVTGRVYGVSGNTLTGHTDIGSNGWLKVFNNGTATPDSYDCQFWNSDTQVAFLHQGYPSFSVFNRSGTTYTRAYPSFSNITTSQIQAFSSFESIHINPADSTLIATAFNTNANSGLIYTRTNDTYDWSQTLSTTARANGVRWNNAGTSLAVATTSNGTAPYIHIFNRSGSTYTLITPALAALNATPTNGGKCSWSPNGEFLCVTTSSSNIPTIYQRSGDTFTKLTNPGTGLPVGSVFFSCWSPDSNYVVFAHNTTPFVTVWNRSGTTFTKITTAANSQFAASLPSANASCVDWSPNGQWLAVSHALSPYIMVYEVAGSGTSITFTRNTSVAVASGTNGTFCKWNNNSKLLLVESFFNRPFYNVYHNNNKVFQQYNLDFNKDIYGPTATTPGCFDFYDDQPST